MSESYCDHCGRPAAATTPTTPTTVRATTTTAGPPDEHEVCRTARVMEPPRYCAACGRRMVVQVTPAGWSARCSRHGGATSGPA